MAGLLSKVFIVGEAIGLAALVLEVKNGISDSNTEFAKSLSAQNAEWLAQMPDKGALEAGLAAVEKGILDIARTDPQGLVSGESLNELKAIRLAILKQIMVTEMLPGGIRNALGGLKLVVGPGKAGDDLVVPGKKPLSAVQRSQNKRGFASGAWDLGSDQDARVHKGEMIVPRRLAQIIRGLSHRGGGSWPDRDPGKDGKDNWTDADQAAAERGMRGGAAHPAELYLERLAKLRDTSHPASGFRQPAGGGSGPFVPGARLDASQIQDRRRVKRSGSPATGRWYDDRNSNIRITVRPSIKDTNTAQDVRGRWGKTPTQVGAA